MKREFTSYTLLRFFRKALAVNSKYFIGLEPGNAILSTAILMLFSLMVSCDGVNSCVKGNGEFFTEARVLESEFSGIEMASSFQVFVKRDTVFSIEVQADSNLLPFIITRVRSGLLLIDNERRCFRTKNPVKINITAPNIDQILLDGSGTVEVDSMDSDFVEIELNGSGDILVSVLYANLANVIIDGSGMLRVDEATSNKFNVNHDGSGMVELNDLQSDEIDFGVDGSGVIDAYKIVTDYIRASVEGSGNVNLQGSRATESDYKIGGSGSIYSYGLYQDFCDVYISGSGIVSAYVVKELKVDIPGSGIIYYKGSPEVALVLGTQKEQVVHEK